MSEFYRLQEGDEILEGDECLTDTHLGWLPANPRTIGTYAPSPLYTSHRLYRRRTAADDHDAAVSTQDPMGCDCGGKIQVNFDEDHL